MTQDELAKLRLKFIIDKLTELNSQAELARQIGRQPQQITQWLKGKPIGEKIARDIEEKLNLPYGLLDKPMNSNSAIYISSYNQDVVNNYATDTKILEENGWLAENLRVMRVPDGGMEPLITEQALVLIDISQTDIESGKIYAVQFGNDILIRRVIKEAGSEQYIATPATFAFIKQPFTKETATILGRLVYRMGEKF